MQYEIEDILRDKEYTTYHLLSILLDACVDELEVLVADEIRGMECHAENSAANRSAFRAARIHFSANSLNAVRTENSSMLCVRILRIEPVKSHFSGEATSPILIPPDVFAKIVEGLLRNAVRKIRPMAEELRWTVKNGAEGPEFEVKDFGGRHHPLKIKRLIFENYFPSYDTTQYSSRNPYDFNAGGKGF